MKDFKTLSVFDFDGTLIDTPTKETGVISYKEKTGKEWPHQGWWGRPETLDMGIFDMEMIPSVRKAYDIERQKPDTMVIMLTGRIPRLSHLVEAILDKFGFKFDGHFYNTGGSTDLSKLKTLEKILKDKPSIVSTKMWDDRLVHIPIFKHWGEQQIKIGRLKDFHVEHVISENPHHK
jgi:hypothetical protein